MVESDYWIVLNWTGQITILMFLYYDLQFKYEMFWSTSIQWVQVSLLP